MFVYAYALHSFTPLICRQKKQKQNNAASIDACVKLNRALPHRAVMKWFRFVSTSISFTLSLSHSFSLLTFLAESRIFATLSSVTVNANFCDNHKRERKKCQRRRNENISLNNNTIFHWPMFVHSQADTKTACYIDRNCSVWEVMSNTDL